MPIATVFGRYFAMDRDKRWDRVAKAYAAIVADAEGPHFADPPPRSKPPTRTSTFDEFVPPAVIGDYAGMRDGDGMLCFNFRADRVREILAALLDPAFDGFPRPRADALRRRGRHDALLRRTRPVPGVAVPARDDCTNCSARSPPTPGAPSFAWRRPRNTRTSPTS